MVGAEGKERGGGREKEAEGRRERDRDREGSEVFFSLFVSLA